MVIRADGSKWACSSCLKGHRVSGCNHTDRELTLVPKKGRPVTQCQHCRLERKKRSAHVSCDCGEAEKPHHPKEKCIHLREAEERAKAGVHDDSATEHSPAHLAAVAEEQGCCCHHGGKCTCAMLRKENDSGDGTPPHGPAVKPRLETTKSEGSITVFQNGHHKPVHRKNFAAHECGMPYKVPMPRAHTDEHVSAKARRSVDSLALDNNASLQPSTFTSEANVPFNTARRLSKSEQPSPKMSVESLRFGQNPKLNTIDFGNIDFAQNDHEVQCTVGDEFTFTPLEPLSGITDSTFDPWSALPSGDSNGLPNNNPFGVWPTNTSAMAQPALTAASSGTQSEIDEIPPLEDVYNFGMPSIQEDTSAFNFNAGMDVNSSQTNRRSLPADFFKSNNLVVPEIGNDWQVPVEDLDSEGKLRPFTEGQPTGLEWQASSASYPTDMPYRQATGLTNSGRPTSRSVGPSSAPNDDVIRQLFPEIDMNGNWIGSVNSPSMFVTSTADGVFTAGATATSNMEFGPTDEVDFTAQPWSDGSMSIPNDAFSPTYNMDDEFSTGFDNNWTQ